MKKFTLLFSSAIISLTVFGQSVCGNKDFENADFGGWSGFTGSNSGSSNLTLTPGMNYQGMNLPAGNTAQQTILTVNNLDSFTIDPNTSQLDAFMTWLAPGGGNVSVRLGNSISGCGAEALKIPVSVTATDTVFTYQYACVFEDPGHDLLNQPGLMVNIFDQNNNLIANLSDTIYSGDPLYAFITSTNAPNGAPIQYKRWSGVSINLTPYIGQTITVEFANFDCGYCGHFGYSYIDVSCYGSLIANVWPGDCDYDLNANNVDLITLGLAYGATGPARSGASNNWSAQPSADWAQWFQLGANYKHSDCNGDGVVDANDTTAILLNYGNSHPFRLIPEYTPHYNNALPDLYLVSNPDTALPSQQVNVDIMLGTNTLPVDSIYAIAFRIYYDSVFINKTSMSASFAGSWMGTIGTDMISLTKNFYSQGEIDFALTKINHANVLGGNGKIGTLTFTATSNTSLSGDINFYLSDVVAVTKTKRVVSLNMLDGLVVFNPDLLGVNAISAEDGISVYPNPSTGKSQVSSSKYQISRIEVYNVMGEKVYFENMVNSKSKILNLDLPAGIYQLKIKNAEKEIIKKIQIVK